MAPFFASVLLALAQGLLIHAAIPDKNSILSQLQKNGACCTALDYFLPGKVHFNALVDLEYVSSQSSYWSAQAKSVSPTCIVIPTSSQDVSLAVGILNIAHQASIRGCKFAVRSAGHTPQSSSVNIAGGVTIDLQGMKQVTVSSDGKLVSIGPGNRWIDIYPKLDELNLAMIGGRASGVGSAGLILGGGVSYFSGRYGFACDNVQTYEIVLANGTITTASSTVNPTLFRALKGGSSNFGIVTRFDTKLYPQQPFWGGTIAHPITNKEALFEFFSNFTLSRNTDPYAALIMDFAWLAGIPSIVHNIAYTDSAAIWPPPAFEALDKMPKIATTIRKDKLTSFTNELATQIALTNGGNNLFVTLTFVNKQDVTEDFMAEVFELADATAKQLLTVVGMIYTMSFQPLPYKLYSKSASTGGNVLGLDRFQDDLINLLFTLSWQLPTDNARVTAALKALEVSIATLAKQRGIFNEFIYLNYGAEWQDPLRAYGSANLEYMRTQSRRYDPTGVFQKAMPGGFKLGI
ncbi:oxidoreductase FAD-binding protein [Dendryphion nanum]|uniref:Oxidoreductase FAD-binding protein n=1 Tax=Dendryphion nanum TaxID=256645 RepID=A0A9P9DA61_9PLEO|nr:oxidoreductase FAD-binding protein [Dendryphion nanum]